MCSLAGVLQDKNVMDLSIAQTFQQIFGWKIIKKIFQNDDLKLDCLKKNQWVS